ncbi:MAG: DnaD domain protein [Chloroflexi bacterium]|nr:DnaD domain protein [Chloroflexota bacterium]
MQGFRGFPPGKQPQIRIPNQFFSELLPVIDHLGEMKITLYCFWALYRQEGAYRYVRFAEALADESLVQGLTDKSDARERVLRDAFERAVARSTLLAAAVEIQGEPETVYFMNTAHGRNAIQAIANGDWWPGDEKRPLQLITERPNIFVLYEQNIGSITPIVAEQLRDAEDEYPDHWLAEAIKIAVEQNKRSWRYIQAILERWSAEGKHKHAVDGRDTSQYGTQKGDYSDFSEC